MEIRVDDLRGAKIAALLQEHLDNMHALTPPESVHALDLERLRAPEITFWTAWDGDELLGCGALKELDATTGEVKSMRTALAHRRRGVAAKLLERIIEEAQTRGYTCLKLETGAAADFTPAHTLYTRYGFVPCPPFTDYTDDPNSIFMVKELANVQEKVA